MFHNDVRAYSHDIAHLTILLVVLRLRLHLGPVLTTSPDPWAADGAVCSLASASASALTRLSPRRPRRRSRRGRWRHRGRGILVAGGGKAAWKEILKKYRMKKEIFC